MKKSFNKIFILPLMALSLCALNACGSADPESVTFTLPDLGENVEIHQEHQAQYLKDPTYNSIGKYAAYASQEEHSKPIPVRFTWDVTDATEYTIEISETEDFKDAISYKTNEKALDVYNLKINTNYYWRVSAKYPSNTFTSEAATFKTTSYGPRNIYLDGVDNVRDLGGYETLNNTHFKQGMLYRSAQLNEDNLDSINTPLVSEEGIKMNNEVLKIKTDIDLRKNLPGSKGTVENSKLDYSPLGENVNYIAMPMYYDGQNILEHADQFKLETNLNSVVAFFNTLAKPSSYPIIFHCVQGKDRTGCLSYLLGALLGVDEDNLYRDYLFTNFSTSVGSPCKESDIMMRYGLTLSKMEGATLSDKAYNYLTDILEIPGEKLNSIRSILCE